MKDLVEVIAKALVDQPDLVDVREMDSDDANTISLELKVAPDDMGKIIGKQGRIAKALRTVVKAAATKDGKKVNIEIQ